MRVSILDLGTNTFNILIADLVDGQIKTIHTGREIAKLGEGGLHENRITKEAFERGQSAFQALVECAQSHNCDVIKAFATSGIRSTTNGQVFIDTIRDKHGISVEVISGDREAELIWKGVRQCIDMPDEALIVDIGGGSTEFILANSESILWKQSFKLGASRLKERFTPEDPISASNIESITEHFNETLQPLVNAVSMYPNLDLIGSSGSFDTFADIMLLKAGKPLDNSIKSMEIPIHSFEESYGFLIKSTYQERLNTPGIIPMRADMIVISGLLTQFVLTACGINRMFLSRYALKEGALSEIAL